MDIYVYVCYWKDLTLLRYCMTPIIPHAKKVIVHDGRFAEFPDKGVRSMDGVEEWCENYGNVDYHPSCCEWESQMEKRNVMWNFPLRTQNGAESSIGGNAITLMGIVLCWSVSAKLCGLPPHGVTIHRQPSQRRSFLNMDGFFPTTFSHVTS